MTILSMTATFGGLENQTLTLTKGLNLLELPNEGGKSTWCAFLRAMFYGVETRKGRETSEKNRFTPWSGKPMAGTIDLVWQGKAITLRRFQKGATPFGGFQAVYTGTEEPVPGLTADNVGHTILGFGREVFERTCFISQNGMAVGESAELEQRLAALASSGEEDVSFSQTEARLRSWRNALRSNRVTGSIPQAQTKLTALETTGRQVEELARTVKDCDQTLTALEADKTAAETDLARHTAVRQEAYRQRYEKAKANLTEAKDAYDALLADESVPAVDEDAVQSSSDATPSFLSSLLFLIAVAVFLIFSVVGLILVLTHTLPFSHVFPFIAISLLGVAGCLIARRLGARRAKERLRQESAHARQLRQEELERRRRDALSVAQAKLDAAQVAWEAASQEGEPQAPEVRDPEPPVRSLEEDKSKLAQVEASIALCHQRRSQALGNIQGLGDLVELEEQTATLRTQINDEEERYAALTTAMEALTAANATLQLRFSPAVSTLAGEILSKLTAHRYDSITFTRAFETLAGTAGGTGKSAKLLSQGTADQSYLALRLAICLLALPDSDCAPIILDDALITFDDKRLSLALQVLQDFAQNRQVLLFTCQGREKAALEWGGLHGTGRV